MFNRPISPWWSVVAGAIGGVLASGPLMVYAYGTLARPMGVELGWDRGVLAANVTAYLFGNGLGLAMIGWLIARFGIRGPSALFVAIYGLAFASVAVLPPSPDLFLAAFLMVGIGGAAATALPYAVAISGFFNARRGLALGIVVAGSGAGATLNPQVAQFLTESLGWRAAFGAIGLAAGLGSLLAIVTMVRTPSGVREDRYSADAAVSRLPVSQLYLRNRHFWIVALVILAVSIAAFGTMVSLVPLFADRGFDTLTATTILSVAGLTSWAGRLIVGYLLDKMFAPLLTALIFALAAFGLLLLLGGGSSVPAAFAGAALVSLALGAEADLLTYLVSRYFRLVDFSRVTGLIWVVWTWGGALGISLAAQSFARFGSYTPAFIGFAAIVLAAAGLVCSMGPYRNPVHPAVAEPEA